MYLFLVLSRYLIIANLDTEEILRKERIILKCKAEINQTLVYK